MKLLKRINLYALVLLSIATGVVKIFRLEADVRIFAAIGFPVPLVVLVGLVQAICGVLLLKESLRKYAAITLAITYVVASAAVFASGMIPFGIVSLLFIGMALTASISSNPEKQLAR